MLNIGVPVGTVNVLFNFIFYNSIKKLMVTLVLHHTNIFQNVIFHRLLQVQLIYIENIKYLFTYRYPKRKINFNNHF